MPCWPSFRPSVVVVPTLIEHIPGVAAPALAGVDEAGRGPLAGPVVAAAVMLGERGVVAGLNDSKKLSASRREALAREIEANSLAHCVVFSPVEEIDRVNILNATLSAMAQAVRGLTRVPELVLIDGNRCPELDVSCRAEVAGDARFACIAAASILAKVARDHYMCELDRRYPGYGFARHKGYGTRAHLVALDELGVTPEHRVSFAPVRNCLSVTGGSATT